MDWAGRSYIDPIHVTETADVVQLRPGRFVVKYRVQANGTPLAKPVDEERILALELVSRFDLAYHDLTLKDLWEGNGPPPGGRETTWGHGERLYQAILTTARKHVVGNTILPHYRGNYVVDVESDVARVFRLTFPEAIQVFGRLDKLEQGRKRTPAEMDRAIHALVAPYLGRIERRTPGPALPQP